MPINSISLPITFGTNGNGNASEEDRLISILYSHDGGALQRRKADEEMVRVNAAYIYRTFTHAILSITSKLYGWMYLGGQVRGVDTRAMVRHQSS